MQLTHRSMIAIVMGVCAVPPATRRRGGSCGLPQAGSRTRYRADDVLGYFVHGGRLRICMRASCPFGSAMSRHGLQTDKSAAASNKQKAKTYRSHAIPPAFHQMTCLMAPETTSDNGPITGGRSPYRVRVRASRSSLIAVACSHRLASMHVCCTVASACTAGAQTGLGFRYGCGRP